MREIVFSKKAGKALTDLLEYLEHNWSARVKNNFISKLDKSIHLIQKDPEIFSTSDVNKKRHKCVVTRQTTIFYSFNSRRIDIVSIFDTRQDPTKIKKIK